MKTILKKILSAYYFLTIIPHFNMNAESNEIQSQSRHILATEDKRETITQHLELAVKAHDIEAFHAAFQNKHSSVKAIAITMLQRLGSDLQCRCMIAALQSPDIWMEPRGGEALLTYIKFSDAFQETIIRQCPSFKFITQDEPVPASGFYGVRPLQDRFVRQRAADALNRKLRKD